MNHWMASLLPSAAVIPAPIVYTKVVAVKTLVVGLLHPVIPWLYIFFFPPFFSLPLSLLFRRKGGGEEVRGRVYGIPNEVGVK